VVSSEVIEHVAAPAAFVKSLAAMLAAEEGGGGGREEGHLVLTTINRTAKAYLLAILGAEHIARMVPKGK
jgi:2-polyprenyl-6-hydroxyphenyl methylase/3-demethylubiquinone-9 3-methyltransferase